MSDIENVKTNIGLDIFMRLTETLQVSADWLLQTDIPPVNAILSNEAYNILADFTPSEVQTLLKIMKTIKMAIHEAKEEKDRVCKYPKHSPFLTWPDFHNHIKSLSFNLY